MTLFSFLRQTPITLAATLLFLSPLSGQTGEEVARLMARRDTGRDAIVTMDVYLTDSRGRTSERTLKLLKKNAGDSEKLLLRFTNPADIRGTSFLVRRHPDGEDERFLYLPALGRSRRLSSGEHTDSFAGTDFTYEDISGRDFDDFTYRLEADTTLASGESCHTLVSTPKEEGHDYSRIVTLVDRESYLPLEATYLDEYGTPFKKFSLIEKEKIGGLWTMMEMAMTHIRDDHSTRILVTSVHYDTGVSDRMFTRRELERGVDG